MTSRNVCWDKSRQIDGRCEGVRLGVNTPVHFRLGTPKTSHIQPVTTDGQLILRISKQGGCTPIFSATNKRGHLEVSGSASNRCVVWHSRSVNPLCLVLIVAWVSGTITLPVSCRGFTTCATATPANSPIVLLSPIAVGFGPIRRSWTSSR